MILTLSWFGMRRDNTFPGSSDDAFAAAPPERLRSISCGRREDVKAVVGATVARVRVWPRGVHSRPFGEWYRSSQHGSIAGTMPRGVCWLETQAHQQLSTRLRRASLKWRRVYSSHDLTSFSVSGCGATSSAACAFDRCAPYLKRGSGEREKA
jgi:hypothetical protein